jgi:hypothetical protein
MLWYAVPISNLRPTGPYTLGHFKRSSRSGVIEHLTANSRLSVAEIYIKKLDPRSHCWNPLLVASVTQQLPGITLVQE